MKQVKKTILMSLLVLAMISPKIMADNDGTASSDNEYQFSGYDIVHTGTTNGYSGNDPIEKGDDHYGWKLGDFYVTGFTSYITDSDGTVVFLKNAGDDVKLSYRLLQDPECLNDDEDLEIHSDGKAWDEYFQTKTYQNSKGLLIIRQTDYQNRVGEPLIYEAFLDGLTKGADTEVHLCEEGDYEVALDYEIEVDGSYIGIIDKDTFEDYRQFFKFKVRNGNCMIFPLDLSGNELTNESYSPDGFVIDFARSRYLSIDVKYMVLVEGRNGLVEDVRYNRPAADGEKYDQSGIYEITIKNLYTQTVMTKTIYVGDDPSIKMMAIDGMSIDEVNESLYPTETEEVVKPTEPIEPADTSEVIDETVETVIPESESKITTVETSELVYAEENEETDNRIIVIACAVGAVVLVALISIIVAIVKKNKKKNVDPQVEIPFEDEEKIEAVQTDLSKPDVNDAVSKSKYLREDIDALPYNGRKTINDQNDADQKTDSK